jgi:hypothetical protein
VPLAKNKWSYTSTPQYASMAWCSVKAQGKLYLYTYIRKEAWKFLPEFSLLCEVTLLYFEELF